MVLIY